MPLEGKTEHWDCTNKYPGRRTGLGKSQSEQQHTENLMTSRVEKSIKLEAKEKKLGPPYIVLQKWYSLDYETLKNIDFPLLIHSSKYLNGCMQRSKHDFRP